MWCGCLLMFINGLCCAYPVFCKFRYVHYRLCRLPDVCCDMSAVVLRRCVFCVMTHCALLCNMLILSVVRQLFRCFSALAADNKRHFVLMRKKQS